MKLLIIEDERKIAEHLKKGLEELHYRVDLAHDGNTGLEMACNGNYQLVILDRMLPGLDGLGVLEELRRSGHRTPVILLTALDRINDRVNGLQAGADDYLTKPFAFAELSARVEAILRRSSLSVAQDVRRVEDLTIIYSSQSVQRQGQVIELTQKEFRILCLLAENPGRLVTRKDLVQKVWGLTFETETNVIDVTVRRLRQKVDDPFPVKLIRTVRGAGYILESSPKQQ
ncbi:response regulator transcription factor [bacterium]|nr:response regulator transcription factor [bacterium]